MYVTGLGWARLRGPELVPITQTPPISRLQPTIEATNLWFWALLRDHKGVGLTRACGSHGEVSDPNHHPGERPPPYDQPLLPGREGAGAEPGASHAGQGPGRPAAVPLPDYGAAGVRQR